MDTYGGSLSDPMSLHKYLFANNNPVKYCDPSGHSASLEGMVTAMTISAILSAADSAIMYWFQYKESDTEKYGSTVFGWNVVTEAANGFLKGFIFGLVGYAFGLLLIGRIALSVVGLVLGISRASLGLDELLTAGGNTAWGVYTSMERRIVCLRS